MLNPAYPAVRSWVDLDQLALRRFDDGVLVRAAEGLRVVADPIRAPHLAIPMLRSGLLRPGELWHLATWLAPALTRPQASTRGPDATLADALDRA
ncbi:MAG: hypothetical protein L0H41_16950, partial [Microlunatus sp.]|nr:hypothetical protein [Microlunatus sp.]